MNQKKYSEFIDSVELIDEIVPEFLWQRKTKEIKPKNTKILINLKSIKPEIYDDYIQCGNTIELKGVTNKDEEVFIIKGTVLLKLKCNSLLDNEYIEFYSKNTVQYSTVPVFRYFVKEALQRMGLPPFTLPLLKKKTASSKKKQ